MVSMKEQCKILADEMAQLQAKIAAGRLMYDNEKALKDRCNRLSAELQNAHTLVFFLKFLNLRDFYLWF